MKVSREDVRQTVVKTLTAALIRAGSKLRVRWPGFGLIDVSVNKEPYINVEIIYHDGVAVGLGPNADLRKLGTLVVEINFKEGEPKDLIIANNLLDELTTTLTSTDAMYPLRTNATSHVTPPIGVQQGWLREGLVTPFWFDTSR